jgi:serine O-acetyltransferase
MTTLDRTVDELLESYRRDPRGQHIGKRYLPSREATHALVDLLFQVFYPGYFGRQDLTDDNLRYHVGTLVSTLHEKVAAQIGACLCYAAEIEGQGDDTSGCIAHAKKLADMLVEKLPTIRDLLVLDVQAAYDGDPAAQNLDEVILAYPGLVAITVHRVAHELYAMGVPLMPRIMSEWAHSTSGVDIHPGATIDASFFIDHATGVVVGETTHIGRHVKLYQGVTLGALSVLKDAHGRVVRNTKRHPTVEDGVTVYANATVLGGQTVLGEGSVVGGSVFLTKSVPKRSRVGAKAPELKVVEGNQQDEGEFPMEFEI